MLFQVEGAIVVQAGMGFEMFQSMEKGHLGLAVQYRIGDQAQARQPAHRFQCPAEADMPVKGDRRRAIPPGRLLPSSVGVDTDIDPVRGKAEKVFEAFEGDRATTKCVGSADRIKVDRRCHRATLEEIKSKIPDRDPIPSGIFVVPMRFRKILPCRQRRFGRIRLRRNPYQSQITSINRYRKNPYTSINRVFESSMG